MADKILRSAGPRAGMFTGIALIVIVAVGGYLVWTGKIAGGKPLCEVCNRDVLPANLFVIEGADGKRRETCCPRCGLRYVLQRGGRALEATVFSTGKRIPAADAIYLEGSDIMICCTSTGFRSADGTYDAVQFDRCMPSLVAFSTREDAESTRTQHGGRIINLDEAKASVSSDISR